ncbi:MAG: hypothetical protein MUF84_12125 [Anaerolineae bacterium]|nr:hypothetical protein [Anaerolineae bacterium]
MDNTSPNGDIGSAPAESVTAPVTATTAPAADFGTAPTSSQPAETGSLTTDATTPGPIPYQRFEEINRRMKDAEERYQSLEQSWGADVLKADPGQIRQMMAAYQRMAADPVGHVTQLLAELNENEQYRPQVASQAARILGALRQHQPKEDPEPQPDLVAENGAPVMSAPRQREWAAWQRRQMQAEFSAQLDKTVAPFKSLVQRQQEQELKAQTDQQANAMLSRARGWHGFKDHEAEIAKVFNAHADWSLQDAYLHVLHEKILPSYPAKAQAQVVADLQSKAAAQTLNPGSSTRPSTPEFRGDFKAALEHFAAKR